MHLLRLVLLLYLILASLFVNSQAVSSEPSQSVNQLKNLLLEDPGNLEARLQLASVYLDAGDLVSAEKELLLAQRLGAPLEDVAESILDIYKL